METQLPPEKRPYKNGVDHGKAQGRGTFAPRSWSFLWRAKVEAAVAIGVIAGVIGVFIYLVQIPGALLVRLVDDKKMPVSKARAECRHPSGLTMAGFTDVFGEAKFPGLESGQWTCEVQPPERFFSPVLKGTATVAPRNPAAVELVAARGVEVEASVVRPEGAPRATPTIRAVCEGGTGWEARAGLLDGAALLYVPRDSKCRLGLVRGAPGYANGVPDQLVLDCSALPCTDVQGKPGARLYARLKPTAEQWQLARPPPEPDEAIEPAAAKK
jgi:hypothetical protein